MRSVAWRRRDRGSADPYKLKPKYSQQPKQKIYAPSAFSFAYAGAKEKAIKKKTPMGIDTYAKHVCRRRRDGEIRALRSATTAVGGRHRLLKKAGENFN